MLVDEIPLVRTHYPSLLKVKIQCLCERTAGNTNYCQSQVFRTRVQRSWRATVWSNRFVMLRFLCCDIWCCDILSLRYFGCDILEQAAIFWGCDILVAIFWGCDILVAMFLAAIFWCGVVCDILLRYFAAIFWCAIFMLRYLAAIFWCQISQDV